MSAETNTNQIKVDSIIYIASTRGYFEKLTLTKDKIVRTNDRSESSYNKMEMLGEDWNKIETAISEIRIEDIPDFQAPSEMHRVDGAALAHLRVYSKGSVYESQTFDHKNPPKQLSSLTDIIYQLTEMISKQ